MGAAIGLAFVAGLITAISPCVLPVLPIVLAGGASGGRRRPYAIIAGLAVTFLVSILFATWILDQLGLPDDLLRNISIALLFVIAATLIFPQVGVWIERPLSRLSRRPSSDLGGGFLLGCALGFVFVPCGGPAIAFVTSSAASTDFGFKTFAVAVAYTVGACIVLLAIALGGQRASRRIRAGVERFRVAFGIMIAAAAFALVFNRRHEAADLAPRLDGRAAAEHRSELVRPGRVRARPQSGDAEGRGVHGERHPRLRAGAGVPRRPAVDQLQAPDAGRAARQGRPDRLLDVLLHQLPAHAAAPEGVVGDVPPEGARDRRRPYARVRVRARLRERERGRAAPRREVPGRARRRLRHVERVVEPVLAGRVPDRPERPCPPRAFRRGRVRQDRAADPAAPVSAGE